MRSTFLMAMALAATPLIAAQTAEDSLLALAAESLTAESLQALEAEIDQAPAAESLIEIMQALDAIDQKSTSGRNGRRLISEREIE